MSSARSASAASATATTRSRSSCRPGAKKPVYGASDVEHVPPDVTAQIFWLKNRDPAHWRNAWQREHTLTCKYILSDKPMSTEQWSKNPRRTLHRTRTARPPAKRRGEPE